MTPVLVPVPAPVIPDGITIQDDRDHLFYCLCSDTLPPIPQADRGFENPEAVWPADPEHFIDCHWASNAMPYQGFLPVNRESIYQCELFKPLNYTVQSIPVFSTSLGTWVVDNTVVEKWKDIEALFNCLRTVLLDGGLVPYTNLDHISFPLPWKYSYHHTKSSRKAMTCAAMRSHDAFIIMAVEISYLLALALSSSDGNDRFHSWSTALTDEIGGNWVDLIRSSWLVQQDTGFWKGREHHAVRVGLFIDAHTCNFSHFLHAYHRWQVPLWIDWGPLQTPFRAVDARLMSQYYIRLPAHRIHNLVKVVKTVSGKHVRNREIHHVSEACAEERSSPPQAGVKVFCWCDVGGDRLVHQRVAPAEVEQIWNEYAPSQKRYYPVQDEWDLSHEFDVDSNPKRGLLSTDDADNDDHNVLGPSEGPAAEMP
ncbi:hypothetical protein EV421DRAFT_1737796 [Armillaria borealis]|uniref:Uncharacterized protein n=1 Tax=Armillaria borealis TaxID=47425 RepID=A0AA39JCU8_9AGAR|nr:hypothetical protein EV421DRAFT_1737796 [Armillaria borealis]